MGTDNKRLLLAVAISVGVMILWQVLFPPPKTRLVAAPDGGAVVATAQADAGAPAVPGAPPPAAPLPAQPPLSAPEQTATLETADFVATFTSYGGAIKSLVLKEPRFKEMEEGKLRPVDLVRVSPEQPYLLAAVASAELGGAPGDEAAARAPMTLVEHDAKKVVFEGRVGAVGLRKTYTLDGKRYELGLELRVSGTGGRQGDLELLLATFTPEPKVKPSFFKPVPPIFPYKSICRAGTSTSRFDPGAKQQAEAVEGVANWAGVDEHYFFAAVLPPQPTGTCAFAKGPGKGEVATALKLPVKGDGAFALTVFAGPKNVNLLSTYNRDLETAIDYGVVTNFFAFFARYLLKLLRLLQTLVHDWGIAIVLLTVVVKGALYPLTHRSMRSMQEMRKLQPEVDALKKKFGEDKERLNKEMMALYQKHGVNPLGGCLPMLLQMPIWFALYATLQTSVELYREPFLWMPDLTQMDPYYVLPLLMGGSSFVMQRLTPQPGDNTQAKMMMYFMPIFFTFIMLKLPAGLNLYIFVNNILSIGQQWWINKSVNAAPPPAGVKAT